jgi:metal-sulfur cluster biosynthetic enzyme
MVTTQLCPMGELNTKAAIENLKLNLPEYEPFIELTFVPSWNHEMILEEGLKF